MKRMLEVKNIAKHFTDFTAIHKIDFYVQKGSFFSILGPSGCGKTTLLRIIAGFEKESNGDIIIHGESMRGIPPEKRPVNIVFQNLALFPMMNVEENVAFGLKRLKLPKDQIAKKIKKMLNRVGLEGFEKKKVTELSGGQRQRVAIARSLILKPSILLLDEPLGALDRKLREHMKVELKLLQREFGATFVYITHDQSEALVMSDKVAVMNKGLFEQIDTPQNLYKNPKTSFVAGFIGENNQFDVSSYSHNTITTTHGWKVTKLDLDYTPKKMFIRPEAFIINPAQDRDDIVFVQVEIKNILFDGANTKLSVSIQESGDEVFISLPQNKQFEELKDGDVITVGVNQENLMCYKD